MKKRSQEQFNLINLIVFYLLATWINAFSQASSKLETRYDAQKDLTTVSMGPMRLSGDRDRYHSLDFSLSHQYPGKTASIPKTIRFDLVSVVKARRLNTDLYVVFVIDGKPTHFGSNRSAVRNPVPGRLWIGERMIFTIPFEEFKKMTEAKSLSVKLGGLEFMFDDDARETLKTFLRAVT